MIDYYHILKISQKATPAEVKSAYRRLARKMHPDVNGDDALAAQDFAKIAKAYQILSNPAERARYDQQRSRSYHDGDSDSVMFSDNPHARRLRRMAVQRRMDAIVDRFIENERQETMALQQTVFPIVALFLSTFFVGMLKPQFWTNSTMLGKSVLLTLFGIGLWHLFGRLRHGFALYTRETERLHDSVLRDEPDEKPFSRWTAILFLISGIAVSLLIGFAVGNYLEFLILNMMPRYFGSRLHLDLIFYPPIAVLVIDTMHTVLNKADI